jgi:hypothetical protein
MLLSWQRHEGDIMRKLFGWLGRWLPWRRAAEAGPEAPQPAGADPAGGKQAKQAVIIVHGMGEQRPMGTLKDFVRSVWELDLSISAKKTPEGEDKPNPNMVWSKPDDRTGSLELRRITTRESVVSSSFPNGVRSDFYELYWADLTAGSTWGQFLGWVRYLLIRPWGRVPGDVRSAWILLWFLAAVVLVLTVAVLLPGAAWEKLGTLKRLAWLGENYWFPVFLAAAMIGVLRKAATSTFGRVVRYTRADPDNIASRAAVRERGLALLRALHRNDDYARIVLVGHSLGSMLAYDLLTYYWAERSAARTMKRDSGEFTALCAFETAAAALSAAGSDTDKVAAALGPYREAQLRLRRLLAARPHGKGDKDGRWIITDFVTLGSPLTHVEFLIATDDKDLENRIQAREMPTAPPYREALDPDVLKAAEAVGALPIETDPKKSRLIAFPHLPGAVQWTLHHAAPFAVVRWTNIHDPSRLVLQGDVIGGPLAPALGRAIADIDLRKLRGQSLWFSHTRYWRPGSDPRQLDVVRKAVNLLDDPEALSRYRP